MTLCNKIMLTIIVVTCACAILFASLDISVLAHICFAISLIAGVVWLMLALWTDLCLDNEE